MILVSSVGYGCLSVGPCAFWVFSDMMCVFVFPWFAEDRQKLHFEEQIMSDETNRTDGEHYI